MIKVVLSITAIMVSLVTLQFANSMIAPKIVIYASNFGASLSSVGLIPTIYGLGFVAGCFWARKLLKTIGHIRSFTVAASMLAILTLLMHFVSDTFAWIIFRGIMGCAVAVILTCVDSWVGHVTPFESRGRVMGFYATITRLAYFGAPALLSYSIVVSENVILFSTLLFMVSLIPICLTKLPQPPIGPRVHVEFKSLYKDAPSAIVPAFVLGLTNSAMANLIPIYGIESGFMESQALTILAAAHLGVFALQWPIGHLSDIFTRRKVIALSFFVATIAALAINFFGTQSLTTVLFLSFIWGGASLSIYSVALSHAIDHVEKDDVVSVCASMLTTWSVGAIFGPLIAGILMESYGASALYLFCALLHGLTGVFVLGRIMTSAKRERIEREASFEDLNGAAWPQNRPLN